MEYDHFISKKTQYGDDSGFDPVFMPDYLFDFQEAMVEWAVRKGRCAIFEDCGLGKTVQEFAWAENVVRHTNGNVLLLTPPAVGAQMIEEAEKFGVEVHRSRDDGKVYRGITITNYEQLHKFNPNDFVGILCDESSILKSFDGATRQVVTDFARKLPYRLLATATAAPNDYIELGTSSEALGYLGRMDMLNRFFKNDLNNSATGRHQGEVAKWRFKGHAEDQFWKWVCSWARAIRKPSDIGFDDERFILPPLEEFEHLVEANTLADGMLFALPAAGLKEQREERNRTVRERCERVAELCETGEQVLIWCHSNEEGDLLEKMIPDAVQVAGKHGDEIKEERFMGFAHGEVKKLITKPKIGAWGMNWQRCHHVIEFPSHSYEQRYQGIRRCYRFGQQHTVRVDTVLTEGERSVLENQRRKAVQADRMFSSLVAEINQSLFIRRSNNFTTKESMPSWLASISA